MTIHQISLWPLEVCCMKEVPLYGKRGAWRGVTRVLTALACMGALVCITAGSASAQPDTDIVWIHNEAQWGSPDEPFLFSGDTLYIDGDFESGREVEIGARSASIHVQEGARLQLSGLISNQEEGRSGLQKWGAGALALSGQNTYEGNTQLHEGILRVAGEHALGRHSNALLAYAGSAVHYAAGATVFNQQHLRENSLAPDASLEWRVDSGEAIQAGTVQGSVPIVKQGLGTLRLTGIAASYPSYFTVNQGALAVDWHLAGEVRVNREARLEGSGIVRSAVIHGGGVLSPGNGIGDTAVLTLGEQLEFKPGAVFEVDAKPSGESDLVQVAGKALLDGEVMTRASAGDWRPSTSFTVLHATDGFEGTQFATATTNLPFLKPVVSYDDTHVYLRLDRNSTPLEEVAETPTEKEVADVLDKPVTAPAPDVPPEIAPDVVPEPVPDVVVENIKPEIQDEIVVMDRPQAREAFNQLSGSWMASVQSAMLEDSRFVREAVLQNTGGGWPLAATQGGLVRQPTGSREATAVELGGSLSQHAPRFWSQAFYSSAERASHSGTPADTRDIGGLVLGLEQPLNNGWRVGGFVGAQHSDMRRSALASARINSLHAGLSLAGRWRDVDLAVGVARSWSKLRSRRTVAVAGLQDVLTGNYRAGTLQMFGELSLPIRWLSPFVRMAWVRVAADGFNESGGAAALSVRPAKQTALLSTIGLRAEHQFETATGVARVRGELAWQHADGNIRAFSRQHFLGDATRAGFLSEGQPLARQAWSLQLGVSAQLAKPLSLNVSYAGQFASGRQDHGARLGIAWVF